MAFHFEKNEPPPWVSPEDWQSWQWQMQHSLRRLEDFAQYFDLSPEEIQGFSGLDRIFQVRTTPYYARLAAHGGRGLSQDPIRRILMPQARELELGTQQMLDPLGERKNSPHSRIVHRYPDRVLFLLTDFCSVYCRYCTRKHFTGQDQAFVRSKDYLQALEYIAQSPGVREVILSGGDPLTLSDAKLKGVMEDLRAIDHVEIIRIGSRIPVVNPMRMTNELLQTLRPYHPIFMMTHFNHPREITFEAAESLKRMVDHGFPVMNQMVLLNGVNNHPALVQALNRRLLYLRVKPYYMFQCDPSLGTDHLRTSVEESEAIQRELWGRLSGLAMSSLSLDIPDGGGKVTLVPDFEIKEHRQPGRRAYRGWDGVEAEYVNPDPSDRQEPADAHFYLKEWEQIVTSRQKMSEKA